MSQCLRLVRRQHCKIAEMGFTGSFRLVGAVGGLKGGKDTLARGERGQEVQQCHSPLRD